MEISFKSDIGSTVERTYNLGDADFTVLITPIIPFDKRAEMIKSVVDMVTAGGEYHTAYENFAIAYNFLTYYTDIRFDTDDNESLSEDICTNVYEFYSRTNILNDMSEIIYDYDNIMDEIKDELKFTKKKLIKSSPWDDIGDKISVLLSEFINMFDSIESEEQLQSVLSSVLNIGLQGKEASETKEDDK